MPIHPRTTTNDSSPCPNLHPWISLMYHRGYVIFHKEINIRFWHYGQCIECALLKLAPEFFSNTWGEESQTSKEMPGDRRRGNYANKGILTFVCKVVWFGPRTSANRLRRSKEQGWKVPMNAITKKQRFYSLRNVKK